MWLRRPTCDLEGSAHGARGFNSRCGHINFTGDSRLWEGSVAVVHSVHILGGGGCGINKYLTFQKLLVVREKKQITATKICWDNGTYFSCFKSKGLDYFRILHIEYLATG